VSTSWSGEPIADSVYVAELVKEGALDRLLRYGWPCPYKGEEMAPCVAAWQRGWWIADDLLERRARREGGEAA